MWEYVQGRWNGTTAAAMYKGPLLKAMAKAYPEHARSARARWLVLEDNDPAGYKSSKGVAAKVEAGIRAESLPCRSPDLNVLDYSLWHTINLRMRKQEKNFPLQFKESEEQFKERLKRTALGLPAAVVSKAVRDMHRRVRMVLTEKGDLFNE